MEEIRHSIMRGVAENARDQVFNSIDEHLSRKLWNSVDQVLWGYTHIKYREIARKVHSLGLKDVSP
jgi:uncharacterized Fe-S radical SAM superfamily protein PflX